MLSLLVVTFNCGKNPPLGDEYVSEVYRLMASHGGNAEQTIPDLLVLGFQELSTLLNGTRDDTIYRILFLIANKVTKELSARFNVPFMTLAENHCGGIGLVLISPYLSKIKRVIKSTPCPVGFLLTSVKGAAALRVQYESELGQNKTEVTLVCAHLNAGESELRLKRRNHDMMSILRGTSFEDGYGIFKPGAHCFFFGDLNYRSSCISSESFDVTKDELSTARRQDGTALSLFSEQKITFDPTYKFVPGTAMYNTKRIPSWCDRVIYPNYPEESPVQYKFSDYNSVPELRISDHVPVYLWIEDVPEEAPQVNEEQLQWLQAARPLKKYDLYRAVGRYTDAIYGSTLFLTTTSAGRLLFLATLVIAYLAYAYLVRWL